MKRLAIPTITLKVLIASLVMQTAHITAAVKLPEEYWSIEQVESVLSQSAEITLAPDLSALTPQELKAIKELMLAGRIFNDIYEISKHPQALIPMPQLGHKIYSIFTINLKAQLLQILKINVYLFYP